MKNNLIAREQECGRLEQCMMSDRSELITIYGRRRVGKTYLIQQVALKKLMNTIAGEKGSNHGLF